MVYSLSFISNLNSCVAYMCEFVELYVLSSSLGFFGFLSNVFLACFKHMYFDYDCDSCIFHSYPKKLKIKMYYFVLLCSIKLYKNKYTPCIKNES